MVFALHQGNLSLDPLCCTLFSTGEEYLQGDPSEKQVFGAVVADPLNKIKCPYSVMYNQEMTLPLLSPE